MHPEVMKIGTTPNGVFVLGPAAVTDTMAILAKRGTGKSNTAVVIAEQMWHAGHQWVAIDPKGDWHGMRSNAEGTGPGLPIPVFGGDHGDLPLTPKMGAFIAKLIVREGITCILDVSDFDTKADQVRFLTDFGQAFYRAAKKTPAPRHLFLEEADEFLPQQINSTGESSQMPKCVGIWTKIVKLGRTAGIGATLITQRSASLNKGALTQIETLVVLRTPSPQDKKAIKDWLSVDRELEAEIMESLPELANGEAWVISPHSIGAVVRVQFDRRTTFDTGATPVAGEPRPAPRLADIDLTAIEEQMAETLESIELDDPEALKKRIKQLEHQLATRPRPQVHDEVVTEVQVPVVPPEIGQLIADLEQLHKRAGQDVVRRADEAKAVAAEAEGHERRIGELLATARAAATSANAVVSGRSAPVSVGKRAETAPEPRRAAPSAPAGGAPARLLNVAAQFPGGLSKTKLALMAGVPPKKSTLRNGLSKLRGQGFIEEDTGDEVLVTAAGIAAAGEPEPFPTGQALIDHWSSTLGGATRTIFEEAVRCYPLEVTREHLADVLGIRDPSTSTIRNGMSKLRGLDLVTGWKANPELFG